MGEWVSGLLWVWILSLHISLGGKEFVLALFGSGSISLIAMTVPSGAHGLVWSGMVAGEIVCSIFICMRAWHSMAWHSLVMAFVVGLDLDLWD